MAQAAMIAAIYVVLTMLGASFAFGEVQIRFSEALTILPAITPAGIPGVFLGCLISNILGGAILPDIIFGSIATLIGYIRAVSVLTEKMVSLFLQFYIQTDLFYQMTLEIGRAHV